MSKVEDLSKQYRDYREQCGIKDPIMLDEIEEAYFEGYRQAEKDLELDWEDMMAIDDLLDELLPPRRNSDELVLKGYYEEVLKLFKERKEK